MKLETSSSLELVYLAWLILAKTNSPALWIKLQVPIPAALAPEDHRPRTAPEDSSLCSRICDPPPSVAWRAFQSLAWVRGGLWLHVILSPAAGEWVMVQEQDHLHHCKRRFFFRVSLQLHLPHSHLPSPCFHLARSDMANCLWEVMICHVSMCCSKNFHGVFRSRGEEN